MSLSEDVYSQICSKVAAHLTTALPADFRGIITVSVNKPVDGNRVLAQNVTVEFRPPQRGHRSTVA